MTDRTAAVVPGPPGSRPVTACLLIIGNEILSGRTQDTNLNHIALTLGKWGIQLREARVVPDVEVEIVDAVNATRRRYDYVFTTGGIGPTHDDITADCIARAFGVDLVIDPEIAAVIQSRPAPDDVMVSRMRMARVPRGATLIDNLTGGPQGFRMENVFVMAGVPAVMRAMLASLEGKLESGPIVRSISVTAFVGESQIAGPLRAIQERHPEVDLGSYPFYRTDRYGTILVMRGTAQEALEAVLREVEAAIVDCGETPQDVQRT
jgi:molybdenum cofactor synthesis domain-containing protein